MFRERLTSVIARLRDRRRKVRKELEEVFGRKFIASVVVGGHLVALLRLGPYALIVPSVEFHPVRVAVLSVGLLFWLVVVVWWKRSMKLASDAADVAEDALDPDE